MDMFSGGEYAHLTLLSALKKKSKNGSVPDPYLSNNEVYNAAPCIFTAYHAINI